MASTGQGGVDQPARISEAGERSTKVEGRFIENLSTDVSRASADDSDGSYEMVDAADAVPPPRRSGSRGKMAGVPPSTRKRNAAATTTATARKSAELLKVPTDDRRHGPMSDRGGRDLFAGDPEKAPQKSAFDADADDLDPGDGNHDDDDGEELHPLLARIYPLSHFIGFRPRSYSHWPDGFRFDAGHRRFNRFHYTAGRILSFGLPPLGHTGNADHYRDASTGRLNLARMYTEGMLAKLIEALHSVVAVWTLMVLLAFMSRGPLLRAHDAPLILAPFGAEAVITFVAYRVELAQPKNILFGNAVAAVLSVALTKAFDRLRFNPGDVYGEAWIAAATIPAAVVFVMVLLGITHPPGGALAVLVTTVPSIYDLDWYLVPVVVFSTLIVLGWALIINNLGARRYPGNFFYHQAFRQPPMLGPEGFRYHDAPYAPRRRGRGATKKASHSGGAEKSAFPLSGRATRATAAAAAGDAGKVRSRPSISSPMPTETGRVTPSGWPETQRTAPAPPPPSAAPPSQAAAATSVPAPVESSSSSSQPAQEKPVPVVAAVAANSEATQAPAASASASEPSTAFVSPSAETSQQTVQTDARKTDADPKPVQPTAVVEDAAATTETTTTTTEAAPSSDPSPQAVGAAESLARNASMASGTSSRGGRRGKRTVQVHYNQPRVGSGKGGAEASSLPAVQWR
ncbi:uncharacterized protein PFL1_00718 [Pseudozyma flocculosa PF-1]|uniref:HPP transmembrane region domain-containing protein n=1 Tax=Pseudozyma flocculosa TaxID=84751 RepID=A0A5C3F595_9BASI|nr:uncharacterized protein PFL1_00718 [Pseudozyma flocculosa PF-1]EPQ31383.1 hypothetical protein PFL1_00718 [Pseudozyma flocculosa PF-1]SPO38837.1 uncharacterized protein PSFLO_04316 [Pseudozyma flocculosa]